MTSDTPATRKDGPCYRCGDALATGDGATLSVTHRNGTAEMYRDQRERVCADCLAAMGLLDVSAPGQNQSGDLARSDGTVDRSRSRPDRQLPGLRRSD